MSHRKPSIPLDRQLVYLLCKDGELAVHSPMLASILLNLGVSCSADQEGPECLIMPDLRYPSVIVSTDRPFLSLSFCFMKKDILIRHVLFACGILQPLHPISRDLRYVMNRFTESRFIFGIGK